MQQPPNISFEADGYAAAQFQRYVAQERFVTSHQELFKIADELDNQAGLGQIPEIREPIATLRRAVNEVGRSFSGSWLGYHSLVYYQNFQPPPPGAHFSQEWGLMDTISGMGSRGEEKGSGSFTV